MSVKDYYEMYKSDARVYSKKKYENVVLSDDQMFVSNDEGEYVLVYSGQDIEYMQTVLRQHLFEQYVSERSFEDEMFDTYETYAYGTDFAPFASFGRLAEEKQIFSEFRHKDGITDIPMNAWFYKEEAYDEGARVIFTMYMENPTMYKGEIIRLISYYEVPKDLNEDFDEGVDADE